MLKKCSIPEVSIFTLGVLLRMSMTWRYHAEWGYDAEAHWLYIQSIAHGSLPDPATNFIAYHPPLYHAIAAGLVKLGASWQSLTWLSVICGVARLGIIWAGLELIIPSRLARLAALALAATLPSSLMIDGMIGNESLNCLLCAAAMLLWLRGGPSAAIGLISGLALLAKTSAIAILAAFGLRRWATIAFVCLIVISGVHLLRGHSPFATSYDIAPAVMGHLAMDKPYLSRRSLGFLAWSWAIYETPYYPVAVSRFFPALIASTFVDYYNHSFAGIPPDQSSEIVANGRPLTGSLLWMGRLAMIGGTMVFIGTLAAWVLSIRRVIIDRKWQSFGLLLIPFLATLLSFAFAVKYPYDAHGVIKGAYVQFAAPPLYAMFGLAVERSPTILLGGLSLITAYSIYCRFL